MAALKSTVPSVPAREYVFVLTDANAKVLGAYGRDVLNENGKLVLGFAEDNKLALLNCFFLQSQKWRVLHIAKRQTQQGTSTFGLCPDKAGGPSTDPLH